MAVTPADVAVVLGRTAPAAGSLELAQWEVWIGDARMLISARWADLDALDQTRLDYVVREAVVAHVRRPDDATSVEVAVDDGREARTYKSGKGRVVILDEWWALLDPNPSDGGAFAIDTAPVRALVHADICTLNFGGLYCSCGAVLTGLYPLLEYGEWRAW